MLDDVCKKNIKYLYVYFSCLGVCPFVSKKVKTAEPKEKMFAIEKEDGREAP